MTAQAEVQLPKPNRHDADIVVVGGGIAGLATADLLQRAGYRVLLLEARDEIGGRVRSVHDVATGRYLADLGPTWVWPEYQPVVRRWLTELGLQLAPQYDQGLVIAETSQQTPPVTAHMPGQHGISRIVGGPQAIVDALAARLPTGVVQTGLKVSRIAMTTSGVEVTANPTVGPAPAMIVLARRVVVSVPARIAREMIDWRPGLSAELSHALDETATWMAPQAKVVALYEEPFWRRQGLSGRIVSRIGPLMEVHDHAGPQGHPAALFGFVGWPHDTRRELGTQLEDLVRQQLSRCFGSHAPEPTSIHIMDWAVEPFVTCDDDLRGPGEHPRVASPLLRHSHFEGRLCFSVAEVADQSPGLIDGAFVAAEKAQKLIAAGS